MQGDIGDTGGMEEGEGLKELGKHFPFLLCLLHSKTVHSRYPGPEN